MLYMLCFRLVIRLGRRRIFYFWRKQNMKKMLYRAAALGLMCTTLTGCGANNTSKAPEDAKTEDVELVVFAAASLTETLDEIAEN